MSGRCFPTTSSCARHRGFVLTAYITPPCKWIRLHEEQPRARCSSWFVTRITASYPSNPSKQSQKRHMARQMWVSLRFITVTHDAAHLTRSHGRKKKKECLFDSGSSFVLCVKKKKKFWNLWSKVKRGPSKRGINSCSSTHQLHSQIGVTDTERLVWMSVGKHWALEGMWITNENDFLVGVSWEIQLVHSTAPASSGELRLVGYGSRPGKRPLTPLPGDVYQPGLGSSHWVDLPLPAGSLTPSLSITGGQLNSESRYKTSQKSPLALGGSRAVF